MPTIQTGFFINTGTPADRTTAQASRKVFGSLFKQSTPGTVVSGRLYVNGQTPLDVLPHASLMQYTVKAGYAVIGRASQGAYVVGTDSDLTVTTTAANATNPRYDRIYIVQPDPELTDTGVARIDVVQGTPAASPSLPALPTAALEIGRKLVPAAATNTTTGTAISDKAAYTGLNVDWTQLVGVPSSFTPAAHSHTVSDISNLTTAGDVAKIGGKRITVSTSTPGSPSVGDVWISYTP